MGLDFSSHTYSGCNLVTHCTWTVVNSLENFVLGAQRWRQCHTLPTFFRLCPPKDHQNVRICCCWYCQENCASLRPGYRPGNLITSVAEPDQFDLNPTLDFSLWRRSGCRSYCIDFKKSRYILRWDTTRDVTVAQADLLRTTEVQKICTHAVNPDKNVGEKSSHWFGAVSLYLSDLNVESWL